MKSKLIAASLGAILFTGAMGFAYANDPATTQPTMTNAQSEQPGTDAWITTKVKAELAMVKGLPSTDISVSTTNGVVTLTGSLDNKAEISKAVSAAKEVKGVKSVDSSGLTSHS